MIKRSTQSFLDSKIVIFEFEGTVAHYTSTDRDVSKILSALAKRTALKLHLLASRDIPELLRALDLTFTELAEAGEGEASKRENEMIETSGIKPGSRFLLKAARDSGMKTACVGLSATTAIDSFLASRELSQAFDIIIGRPAALAHMQGHGKVGPCRSEFQVGEDAVVASGVVAKRRGDVGGAGQPEEADGQVA